MHSIMHCGQYIQQTPYTLAVTEYCQYVSYTDTCTVCMYEHAPCLHTVFGLNMYCACMIVHVQIYEHSVCPFACPALHVLAFYVSTGNVELLASSLQLTAVLLPPMPLQMERKWALAQPLDPQ